MDINGIGQSINELLLVLMNLITGSWGGLTGKSAPSLATWVALRLPFAARYGTSKEKASLVDHIDMTLG